MVMALVVLAGCAGAPEVDHSARYTIKQDRAPSGDFDASGLADARPRFEAPRRAGNKSPYTVWGKSYRVMGSNEGYIERGLASWYGEKFHGHTTSNGEIFDMYAMSAAHKSLRIPGYARVTNLDNGRSVIVRVNDRGPFHDDRLIDLSYAAAKKLGFHNRGTARVEVAAITVEPDGAMTLAGEPFVTEEGARPEPAEQGVGQSAGQNSGPARAEQRSLFVQLGSFGNRETARTLQARAQGAVDNPVRVREIATDNGRFHRVQVGPFVSEQAARQAQTVFESRGFGDTAVLTDTH
ncbi:MAG: septal ring lytic transglycosylase RlpA family protein [Alteromonadaceae bacterium]|nr:septal ring lytic transglycosylase RlpA family protein [Alteromonadaceae bacterium]